MHVNLYKQELTFLPALVDKITTENSALMTNPKKEISIDIISERTCVELNIRTNSQSHKSKN